MPLMGSLARAGKNKSQTPFVPKTSEKENQHKKAKLRKKYNVEVKSHCTGDDMSKLQSRSGLTHKDVERQLFIREKRIWYEAKQRSRWDYPSEDSNTKKPHKKDRQTIDEFYYQEMFGGDVEL